MTDRSLDELEEALGHRFRDRDLLVQALTHSSRKTKGRSSNERMEFLGDAVLGMIVSDRLYRRLPEHTEGELTRARSAVVSRPALLRWARRIGLEKYLDVAKGVARPSIETGGGRRRQRDQLPGSILSDAAEAIIAAVYLDAGIRGTRRFVLQHLAEEIKRAAERADTHNYKSALQQFVQREMNATPGYRVVAEKGPDHGKVFEVVTVIRRKRYGAGVGPTKKAAEQIAARETLKMMGRVGEG